MKKKSLLISLSLIFVAACAGSGVILTPSLASALQGITGVDALMGVPCASVNYFRVAPHICKVQGVLTATSYGPLLDTTCRTLDLTAAYTLPTSATLFGFFTLVQGGMFLDFYKENTCTTLLDQIHIPATASVQFPHFVVPIQGGQLYLKSAANYVAACGINCTLKPTLYYD